ncbi:hypothetical protein ROS217_12246 [Roseovarius sp. 217]|jgi:hypothetical protein|nr:hypothetical protein ROS217_12246 [Roseovarius sp. 217]
MSAGFMPMPDVTARCGSECICKNIEHGAILFWFGFFNQYGKYDACARLWKISKL